MLGMDRKTGRRIDGFDQLVSRVTQVMTTPLVGRAKRPKFGSKVRENMGANMTDAMIVKVQSAAIEAFYHPNNGLSDFVPSRCVAKRLDSGLALYFEGVWDGQNIKFEVPVSVPT